ncbi:hypothetical protein COW36_09580 [bacterium (Candidatus Blackallbacteria) CG17_big_fil_post_rev_8_21_14_2_50_48_46]|uniref:Uncharacterized protein n=1 Tax=bacterium (Candidatus Blackallbacteria) CG17_big_fil_post_rev_8_21_14_2_50_48_46 TaxID=2014261 RepID=A0A2M7G5G2_9BACT|nr:MAG: hypothetical protein COW64_01830 [bacterium (Candidatus Blackallbacteria) CG18_big_fil_WC_8_21_14_2_50_49_26]PIW17212.1 MAG: hypothetical protein COW36_09580 [bacterium (Candidatus Blackallbacteria) CG17_big_fil_post_rev_8_21_14_2_50_48_46]PIW51003.1 MAG: hypothetical protein COW20_00590 [bacterium (Candidatus Blackallbacteria) CG13_big_fil_rev_8_21_14_2_50_49_14]
MQRVLILMSLICFSCQTPLPNLPVPAQNNPQTSLQNGIQLSLPFAAYKEAYQGFYPNDQFEFQVLDTSPVQADKTPLPIFKKQLKLGDLEDTLQFNLPLQAGRKYRYALNLHSQAMGCGGPILDGEFEVTASENHYTFESQDLEVISDLPEGGSLVDSRPLSGFVKNKLGQALAGIEVQLENPGSGLATKIETNQKGWFVWGKAPLSTEVKITVTPKQGAPLVLSHVLRRRDDKGALRGVCDPSLNQLEIILPE